MNKQHFHTALHEGYPEIKPKSLNQYSTVINAFCKKRNITSDEELADIEKMESILHNKELYPSVSTRSNIYYVLQLYLSAQDPEKYNNPIQKYLKNRELTQKVYQHQHSTGKLLNKQEENQITYKELVDYYDEICKICRDRKYNINNPINGTNENKIRTEYLNLKMLLRLYILYPSRNEYSSLKMITWREYKKLKQPVENYLVFTSRNPGKNIKKLTKEMFPTRKERTIQVPFLSIANYKTSGTYGIKLTEIKDTSLEMMFELHRKIYGFGYMFPDFLEKKRADGTEEEKDSNLALSQFFIRYSQKHIKKNISSTMIYKTVISEAAKGFKDALITDNITEVEKYSKILEKFALTRGHNATTQEKIYLKDI